LKVRVLLAAPAAVLFCLSIALPAQQPASAPYSVVTREGRRPLATRVFNGQEMFALDDLARLFNLAVREDAAAGGITITSGSQSVVLSQQQPLASVGGRMISLPAAAVRDGRAWYVPVDFVSRALAPIHAPVARLELRKPSRLLLVGDIRMPRVAARVEPLGSVTRVTLEVAPPTPHTITQDGQQRLVVRFDADALDAPDVRPNQTSDTLQNIRTGDTPQSVTLDLGPRFASFRAADQPGPAGSTRVMIDLVAQTETAPPPGTPQTTPTPTPVPPAPDTPPLLDLPPAGGLRTIVIDAGHGGDDAGAKGAQGTLEKTVTLGVARRLKAAIEARLGVRVLLTRDGDQPVPSDQRAALANNNKADLFISLHANASVRPGVAGVEVFYLTLEGYGAEAQRAATGRADSLPVLGGGTRDIEITPWEMAQARHIDQSAAFARAVEAALHDRVPMSARPLQQAPLRVLVGANMPAVLVEMGFLTNPREEQQLAGDERQNTIAQALVDGILRYRSSSREGTR
jgi:N-acetylmuramoyl-L-alanine amidase